VRAAPRGCKARRLDRLDPEPLALSRMAQDDVGGPASHGHCRLGILGHPMDAHLETVTSPAEILCHVAGRWVDARFNPNAAFPDVEPPNPVLEDGTRRGLPRRLAEAQDGLPCRLES